MRGDIEINALAGIHPALAIEGLMIADFGIEDHGQEVWTCAATGNRMEWCRWLADCLAGTYANFLCMLRITLHARGTLSRLTVMVSPNLANAPPRQGTPLDQG